MPSTRLSGAVEAVFAAADPAVAADRAGLDFGHLDPEDQQLLAQAHREAIGEGIALIGAAAAGGDLRARRWLSDRGLPMTRRGPYRRRSGKA